MLRLVAPAAATALAPVPALAAGGLASLCLATAGMVGPDAVWSAWSLSPATLIPLGLLLALRLRARSDIDGDARRLPYFLAGWLLLAAFLVSPLCRLAATLVSAHMVQHMAFILAVPLLLALGGAHRLVPRRLAARTGPALGAAAVAHGAAIWLWHAPPVYAFNLTDPVAHVVAVAGLVAVSTWFWTAVLAVARGNPARALSWVFATMIHTGLLGAIITFAANPLYPVLAAGAPLWGLTPMSDQQLAGLVMWVPGGLAYAAVMLVVAIGWLMGAAGLPPLSSPTERRPS